MPMRINPILSNIHDEFEECQVLDWISSLEKIEGMTGHSWRVADLTVQFAQLVGLVDLDVIVWGALSHDIGKLQVPRQIVTKPAPLPPAEWAIIKRHPAYAYEKLSGIRFMQMALDIPYLHHERWDGAGYPLGLSGASIPLPCRIFSIVDMWDALTHDRPYRKALPPEHALSLIRKNAGSQFDPDLVPRFIHLINKYPPVTINLPNPLPPIWIEENFGSLSV